MRRAVELSDVHNIILVLQHGTYPEATHTYIPDTASSPSPWLSVKTLQHIQQAANQQRPLHKSRAGGYRTATRTLVVVDVQVIWRRKNSNNGREARLSVLPIHFIAHILQHRSREYPHQLMGRYIPEQAAIMSAGKMGRKNEKSANPHARKQGEAAKAVTFNPPALHARESQIANC